MHDVALSLGSNSGDRLFYMTSMQDAVRRLLISTVVMSDLFETAPVDVAHEQPWYLNRIIRGYYKSTVQILLQQCQAIETNLGRTDKGCKKERTADIDILLFDCSTITTAALVVPHPALLFRRFCIEGLFQVMPDVLLPTTGKTIRYHHATMDAGVRGQQIKLVHGKESGHG